jgi:hypothetical protein
LDEALKDYVGNNISIFEEYKEEFLTLEKRRSKPGHFCNTLSFMFLNHIAAEQSLEVSADLNKRNYFAKYYQLDSLSPRGMLGFAMVLGSK